MFINPWFSLHTLFWISFQHLRVFLIFSDIFLAVFHSLDSNAIFIFEFFLTIFVNWFDLAEHSLLLFFIFHRFIAHTFKSIHFLLITIVLALLLFDRPEIFKQSMLSLIQKFKWNMTVWFLRFIFIFHRGQSVISFSLIHTICLMFLSKNWIGLRKLLQLCSLLAIVSKFEFVLIINKFFLSSDLIFIICLFDAFLIFNLILLLNLLSHFHNDLTSFILCVYIQL